MGEHFYKIVYPLDAAASAYCSVWIVLTSESIYELWRLLIWGAAKAGLQQPAPGHYPHDAGANRLYPCRLYSCAVYRCAADAR